MDKRGFVFFYAFMVGLLFFFLGLALAPSIHGVVSSAMSSPQINCSNDSISDQDHAVCTQMDLMAYLYVGLIFGLSAFILTGVAL